MIEGLRDNFNMLVSLYEKEHQRVEELSAKLSESQAVEEACRKQLSEMERQIENLKLTQAFTGTAQKSSAAAAKIDSLIREIDKCISLIEK